MALNTVEKIVEKLSPEHRKTVEQLAKECFEADGDLTEKQALGEGYQIFFEQQCELHSPEYLDFIEEMSEVY